MKKRPAQRPRLRRRQLRRHLRLRRNFRARLRSTAPAPFFPITEAVAEEFNKVHSKVRVNVAVSGTGGGFKRFTVGDTVISNASRPIKDSEAQAAADNGIEYLELRVAVDGLSVIVNPNNDFVDCLTVDALGNIWKPDSTVKTWKDVNPRMARRRDQALRSRHRLGHLRLLH